MSAYAVAHLRTVALGPEIFEYIARIDATLEPFGGRFLIHGGPVDAMDGNWSGDLVVIAFRDVGPPTPGTRLQAIRPFCGCAPTIRMATPSSSMACRMGTRLPTRSRSWFPPRPPDVMGVGENLFPRNYACPICRLYPVVQASKQNDPAQLLSSRERPNHRCATPCQRSSLRQASTVSPSWIEKVRAIVGDCQPVSLDGDWPGLTGTGRLCCTSREGEIHHDPRS